MIERREIENTQQNQVGNFKEIKGDFVMKLHLITCTIFSCLVMLFVLNQETATSHFSIKLSITKVIENPFCSKRVWMKSKC